MEDKKTYTLRIPAELLAKYHYIARYDGRSVNAQLLVHIKKSIADFEKENGKITLE